jgi:hypothetical protein
LAFGEKKEMLKPFRKIFSRLFFIDLDHDYKNSVLLAGVGRSGTTWLSDIINYDGEYRYMHEPFHPYRVRLVRDFHYIQYLRPENRNPRYLEPAKALLSGRLRNRWTDSDNNTIFARKRLIKDIRANLLLKWIHSNFPEIPIILLFRHPCAVANSWLKLGWGKEDLGIRTDIEVCLSQEELMEDFLGPFRMNIDNAESEFEQHVFFWCMQYYVPLKQFKHGEIHLCFYENLCENPHEEIERLFVFLSRRFSKKVLCTLRTPSTVSRKDSAIVKGTSLIDSWRTHITDQDLEKALDILSIFGLDEIYSDDSMPNVTAAYELLRSN